MKNKIVLLIFCIITSFSHAQQDAKAKEILDRLAQKTKTYETMKADFTYIYESLQQKVNDTTTGTIYIKGNKYK